MSTKFSEMPAPPTEVFLWGMRFSYGSLSIYALLMAAIYFEYLTIDPKFWASFYPGFSLEPKGLFIGLLWAWSEGFSIGFLCCFVAEKLAERKMRAYLKKLDDTGRFS